MQKHRRTEWALAVALGLVAAPARADQVSFTHTWDGTESIVGRGAVLFHDGVPSMAGIQKPFPGTHREDTAFFDTLTLFPAVKPGTVVGVQVFSEDAFSFLSIYQEPFNPGNLSTGYLGDQGQTTFFSFSVTAPANRRVVVVANSAQGFDAIGHSFAALVTFTPAAVPEPAGLTLAGVCIGGLALRAWRRRRTA